MQKMNIKYNLYNKRLVIYSIFTMQCKIFLRDLNILLYFMNNLYSIIYIFICWCI